MYNIILELKLIMDKSIKDIFYEKFSALLLKKREDNYFYLSTEKYNKYIGK